MPLGRRRLLPLGDPPPPAVSPAGLLHRPRPAAAPRRPRRTCAPRRLAVRRRRRPLGATAAAAGHAVAGCRRRPRARRPRHCTAPGLGCRRHRRAAWAVCRVVRRPRRADSRPCRAARLCASLHRDRALQPATSPPLFSRSTSRRRRPLRRRLVEECEMPPSLAPNGGKVTPKPAMDVDGTRLRNLTVLQRLDPAVEDILITAAPVTLYDFNIDLNQWSRKDVEGSLFVVKRNKQPRFQFIVMNRRNTDNLVEDLLSDFEYELQPPYLLYRNAAQEDNGGDRVQGQEPSSWCTGPARVRTWR